MGVTRHLPDLYTGVINPNFASLQTISSKLVGQHPGVYKEHSPSFVGGGGQRSTRSKPTLCYLSNLTLKVVQKSVGHLKTSWSHENTLTEGSCQGIDGTNSSFGSERNRNDVNVTQVIPDMWQFCRTIGQGNHDNTPYNVLCCGKPPNFVSKLQRLSRLRRHTQRISLHVHVMPTNISYHKAYPRLLVYK
jgi:hypothetical protein